MKHPELDALVQDLQTAPSGANRLKSQVIAQGNAVAVTGGAAPFAAGPGLRQAFAAHPMATGAPGASSIAAGMANTLADGAVDIVMGRS